MNSNFKTPILFKDSSVIENSIIKDSDIFNSIGCRNYIILNRKFPNYFEFFEECFIESDIDIGYIPSSINLYISEDPVLIKSDIIKTIFYKTWISENSNLVLNSDKYKSIIYNQHDDTIIIFILISIVIIILFLISTYILIYNKNINKFLS